MFVTSSNRKWLALGCERPIGYQIRPIYSLTFVRSPWIANKVVLVHSRNVNFPIKVALVRAILYKARFHALMFIRISIQGLARPSRAVRSMDLLELPLVA